jgi:hypothetical protein
MINHYEKSIEQNAIPEDLPWMNSKTFLLILIFTGTEFYQLSHSIVQG